MRGSRMSDRKGAAWRSNTLTGTELLVRRQTLQTCLARPPSVLVSSPAAQSCQVPPRCVLAQMPDMMEPRSCGPIRGESGQKAKTNSGGGARGRGRPLRRRVAHHGPSTSECAGCHVLPRPRLASSTKRGPTVFAGFGVGQAGAQSGAVPLGAMQLSRCPDRSRLDAVTMPEEGPVPTQMRPAPGIWGS